MKDITGRELGIGQTVVTNIGGYTDSLVSCRVVGFTPMMVRLTYFDGGQHNALKYPEQLSIVSDTPSISTMAQLELEAWQYRFPMYEYRPQDDCIALKKDSEWH